ncbi:MAG: hypothetical protein EOL87_00835 [Spartobacteria bacterium]|nr:hypothetical protein [Spartobacteria bacterium]
MAVNHHRRRRKKLSSRILTFWGSVICALGVVVWILPVPFYQYYEGRSWVGIWALPLPFVAEDAVHNSLYWIDFFLLGIALCIWGVVMLWISGRRRI